MADLSTIRRHVEERLTEIEGLIAPLRAELDELRSVAERFTSSGSPSPAPVRTPRRATGPRVRRPKASTAAKSPVAVAPRRSASGRSRAEQAISLIAEHPGMSVPEMAKAMGIGSNYLYRVLPQLQKEGKLTKQGKGYHPVAGPSVASIDEG